MKKSIQEVLRERRLVCDGAMGTQLMLAGLEQGGCGEHWNLSYPDRVLAIQRRYVEAGSGPRLRSLHEAVKPQAERYIRMYIALLLDTVPTAGSEHDDIVNAIHTGNTAAAQKAVQTNWRHASDRLVRAIEVMGEQGNW